MLTDAEQRLVDACIADGFGTARFALSVQSSGKCTVKQYETMQKLHSAACYRRNNPPRLSGRQTRLDCAFADYGEGGDF